MSLTSLQLGVVVPKMFNAKTQRTLRIPAQEFPKTAAYKHITPLHDTIRVTTSQQTNEMRLRFFDAYGTEYLTLTVFGMPIELLEEITPKVGTATRKRKAATHRNPSRRKRVAAAKKAGR
jgi:hypothetical protein